LLKAAAEGPLKGILGYEERAAGFHRLQGRSAFRHRGCSFNHAGGDKTQVKVLAWYDNEWGYVNRMAELTRKVARTLPAKN
jgi:glyceraldehyde 3-phosphate dehydrogenase